MVGSTELELAASCSMCGNLQDGLSGEAKLLHQRELDERASGSISFIVPVH